MEEKGFCQKDSMEWALEKGCRHPSDYCQFRQACMIHFLEKERRRGKKEEQDEDPTDQR